MRTKSYNLAIILISSVTLFFPSNAKSHDINTTCAQADAGVGEIVVSILEPADFERLYGNDWRLMDGSSLDTGAQLSMYLLPHLKDLDAGTSRLPDARGKFIRIHNNGATGPEYDPEDRALGDYQPDEIGSHSHQYTVSTHTAHQRCGGDCRSRVRGSREKTSENTGGAETRPKNISLNLYVRVDVSDQDCGK